MSSFRTRTGWLVLALLLTGTSATQPVAAQRNRSAAASPAAPVDMSKLAGLKPRAIGPGVMSGRITAVDVVRRDPNTIYAGAASGGLWRSTNGGLTWTPLTDSLPTLSIGAVAINQTNPDVIWIGTGEGNPRNSQSSGMGVYRSIDAGRSWQKLGLDKTFNIHRIILHPTDANTAYVGVQGSAWGPHPDRGVYKTTDGGRTWAKVLFANESTGIADLVMDPSNPNKLFAAMWQFERKPWVFKSGGAGSGLHVTHDGGATWRKLGERDSLPGGEWGRVGIALCHSKPNVVYAMIETKKNGLFRSDDGGVTWRRVAEKGYGDRPFYYSELYVDPQNENRVYSLYSRVSRSEDGGKTWQQLLDYGDRTGVHPDHHAWYIHPDNPNYIVNGNDGGVYVSRDAGASFYFANNVPVGQFYHINVDNLTPYNVYGGLQDNGSWTGPAYQWRGGGIRNNAWQMMVFGDGFDMVPDPQQPERYGYGMSQGGFLARYDKVTGDAKLLKPAHPDGKTDLRFNWNAGIALDPFRPGHIYYGSQFLLHSPDKGASWSVISPDLTTNDTTKQRESRSTGGLTLDVTGAENHCTILTIAPSNKQQGVIWVGTDDGNVQLTRDGGKTWSNQTPRIQGLPKNAWIAQIVASPYEAGEAYVVANNYRQGNDWNPYLYRTRDFGATWQRLTPPGSVAGYTLCVAPDAVQRNLIFLGTEGGLYVSFDGGTRWQQWTNGYPKGLSTYDMVIHPKEHDLVIGTFGRGIYVLDDIRPLRAIAAQGPAVLDKTIAAYEPPTAYQVKTMSQTANLYFPGLGEWQGENRPYGAMLTFSVKEGKAKVGGAAPPVVYTVSPLALGAGQGEGSVQGFDGPLTPALSQGERGQSPLPLGEDLGEGLRVRAEPKKDAAKTDSVRIEIFDATGTKVRTMKVVPETGINRVTWELSRAAVRGPAAPKPKDDRERAGNEVLPGTYKVRYTYKGASDSTSVTVVSDPRLNIDPAKLAASDKVIRRQEALTVAVTSLLDRVRDAQGSITAVTGMFPAKTEAVHDSLKKTHTRLQDSLKTYLELVLPKEGVQGIIRDDDLLGSRLGEASYIAGAPEDGPIPNYEVRLTTAEREVKVLLDRVNRFFGKDWTAYRQQVDALKLSPFKPTDEPVQVKN